MTSWIDCELVAPVAEMHPAFTRLDHRPWPLPRGPWVARQTWHDVLFAHWPVAVSALRPFVPAALDVQEFDGTAWVGLVPFRMTGVTARWMPPIPWLSAFPEMNLRLYVAHRDRPGVWFVSLDAARAAAVWAARRFFHLPYHRASMVVRREGSRVHYHSERIGTPGPVDFVGTYWPTGAEFEATPGSIEHFLTERYCLYAERRDGTLATVEIHHRPWPLHRADATIDVNRVATGQGLAAGGTPALLHFAPRLDVVFWPMVASGTNAGARSA
jgi:uncharacterized protein YqjF (DUF2071 family)